MAPLETREIEHFVAVAETLHFRKAAERLGIAQPALSRTIARLERRLGVRLFDRSTRSVTLTHAGEVFHAECRSLLQQLDGAVRRVRRAVDSGSVVVAVRPGTGQGPLADVLTAHRRAPGAEPVDVVFTHLQESALRDGTADIALTCQTAPLPADLARIEVGREEPVALLRADHPLAHRLAVTLADLLPLDNFDPVVPPESMESVVDRVALGDLVVITGETVRRRLTPAVRAVRVLDTPRAHLHLAWLPTVDNPARDALLSTAEGVLGRQADPAELPLAADVH